MNRKLVLERRDEVVAAKITEYLKATDRYAKTIVFCEDIDHAARMRQALSNANADICATQPKATWCRSPATTQRASASSTTSSTPRSPTRSSPPPPS